MTIVKSTIVMKYATASSANARQRLMCCVVAVIGASLVGGLPVLPRCLWRYEEDRKSIARARPAAAGHLEAKPCARYARVGSPNVSRIAALPVNGTHFNGPSTLRR